MKTLQLFKVIFKNTGMLQITKNRLLNTIIVLLLFVSIAPIIFLMVSLVSVMYDQLILVDQAGLILGYLSTIMAAVIFFFGIFYIMAVFYYSKDITHLIYLPLKPRQIVGAKLLSVIVYEYIMIGLFFIPAVIMYGIKAQGTVLFYLYALVSAITIPVIPLTLAGIVVMVVMRFTNLGKRKELMTFISMLLLLTIALGFNFAIQSLVSSSNLSPEKLVSLMQEGGNSLMRVIGNLFPGMQFSALAMANFDQFSGFLNLLLFLLINIIGIVVFLTAAEFMYFEGAIGMSDTTAKRERLKESDWEHVGRGTPVILSYMKREIKLLLRSPVYFLNSILISVLLPLIFFLMLIFAPSSDPEIKAMFDLISSAGREGIKVAVLFASGLIMGGMNGIAGTAISREGNGAGYMKFLPVPVWKQVLAKTLVGIIVAYIGVIIFSMLFFYMGITMEVILPGLGLALIGVGFSAFCGIAIDLVHPKLHWDNEQQAMKQNMNLLITILFSGGVAAVVVCVAIAFGFDLITSILVLGSSGLVLVAIVLLLIKGIAIPFFEGMDL